MIVRTETGTITLHDEPMGTEWEYEGDRGPEHWGQLDSAWQTCSGGVEQSPIDIVAAGATDIDLPDIQFDYHETALHILNNGHTIEVEYHNGSTITVGTHVWELLQFHFHTPSEHTFEEGSHFEVELHAVHSDGAGRLAVMAIMIKRGAENHALPEAFELRQVLPGGQETDIQFDTLTVNLADLLPADRRYYTYRGSLTTPPCTEAVTWFVIPDPIEMSEGQIRALKGALNHVHFANSEGAINRPTQPLNGRPVFYDTH